MKRLVTFFFCVVVSALLFASSSVSAASRSRGPVLYWNSKPYYSLNYIYVANAPSNSITVYRSDQHDQAHPYMTIAGSRTKLDGPIGLAFDERGELYVVNRGSASSVTVYAPNARGNVAPIRVLEGPKTLLRHDLYPAEPPDYPWGSIAVDSAHNRMFIGNVSTADPQPYSGNVLVFRANANGNEPPIGSIGPGNYYADQDTYGFTFPAQLAFAHRGKELIVGNLSNFCCNGGGGWAYYRTSDLSYLGNLAMYANNDEFGAAEKPIDGKLVSPDGNGILVWNADVMGETFPDPGYPAPISSLQSPFSESLSSVTSDSDDTVWALSGSTVLEGFEAGHTIPRLITGLVGATAIATIIVKSP